MVSPIWPVAAEINEARLIGMECESISCKALAQDAEDPLGIEEALERHHGIISEADKGTSPLETWPHLTLKPFIQDVVQEDVIVPRCLLTARYGRFMRDPRRPAGVLVLT